MTLAAISGKESEKINFAQNDSRRYAYECIVKETGLKFLAAIVDYERGAVFRRTSQSDTGIWYSFDEVKIKANADFWPLEKL